MSEEKRFEFSLDLSPKICVMRTNFNGETFSDGNILNANNFVTRRKKKEKSPPLMRERNENYVKMELVKYLAKKQARVVISIKF